MTFTSNDWETLGDIKRRLDVRGEQVVDTVGQEFRAGLAECRFLDEDGIKIIQFRKRNSAQAA